MKKLNYYKLFNLALIILGVAAVIILFSDIVSYFVISFILAALLKVPTNYLSQNKIGRFSMPRAVAVLCSFGILLSLILSFILIFKPLVSEQIHVISDLDYEKLLEKLNVPLRNIENFLVTYRLMEIETQDFLINIFRQKIFSLGEQIDISYLLNQIVSFTSHFFVALLAVTFITFFLLLEKGMFRKNAITLIPNKYFEMTIGVIYKIEKLLSNYLLGLLLQMSLIFTGISLALSIAGVKYALTVGLFAAVVHVIPFVGPVLSTIFGLIVVLSTTSPEAVLESGYGFLMAKNLIAFGTIYLLDNIFLQPIIFSKSVKAHPLEIFVMIFAGANLAGAIGMVMAIPIYTILKVSLTELQKSYRSYQIFKA
ncbi:MAG: AI-2E family transporter [Bacteroidetes bacterium]|nr:MAG: AI-2E family transporter [Bacteroidota bacterium]